MRFHSYKLSDVNFFYDQKVKIEKKIYVQLQDLLAQSYTTSTNLSDQCF